MIVQLPNGRIVEMSVEEYLDMTDQEIKDLNGLSNAYTKQYTTPFYDLYSANALEKAIDDMDEEDTLLTDDEIDLLSHRGDSYFFPEDEGDFI